MMHNLRMTMTRTFQPVGQGAFYTEQFSKDDGGAFNMVYDCGSDSLDIRSLSQVIKKHFKRIRQSTLSSFRILIVIM